MKATNLKTITNLFEESEIRSVWNNEKEDYYFSVVDVIKALTDNDYQKSRNYWKVLKYRLVEEGSDLVKFCNRLKMLAQDGKMRETDTLNTEGILRLIESIPSPKAEPFKMWLAKLGKERIDEVFDPENAINRAIDYYRNKGYDDSWIEVRLKGILNRKKLTNVWKENGIKQNFEYAILTNEIYKTWSGMKSNEYKQFKGLRKESLRDNMSDIEIALTDIGEMTTRDIAKKEKPLGLKENMNVARRGGNVAKTTRLLYEQETGNSAITSNNNIGIKYID